ncbi:hypothetical protein QBC39DRAFT_360607 [Podospora conica]|nr:hypothetical protein QBC39DRAFT_360607 [Schizothecium conicum]
MDGWEAGGGVAYLYLWVGRLVAPMLVLLTWSRGRETKRTTAGGARRCACTALYNNYLMLVQRRDGLADRQMDEGSVCLFGESSC